MSKLLSISIAALFLVTGTALKRSQRERAR